ncbi:MAG: hypothetical protein AVDCRST_MAG19-2651, partial [uncultured Thermomicrobiales bacterium]
GAARHSCERARAGPCRPPGRRGAGGGRRDREGRPCGPGL